MMWLPVWWEVPVNCKPQGVVEPALEVGTADPVAADPDVRGEQVDVRIEVAHVQRQRVLGDELADFLDGLEPADAGFEISGGGHGTLATSEIRISS